MGTTAFSEIRVFSKDKDFLPKLQAAFEYEWSCWEISELIDCPKFEPMSSVKDKVFRGKLRFCARDTAMGDYFQALENVDIGPIETAFCTYTEHDLNDPGTGLFDNELECILFKFDRDTACEELDEYIRGEL